MKSKKSICLAIVSCFLACLMFVGLNVSNVFAASKKHENTERAKSSYTALQRYFYLPKQNLYHENYNLDDTYAYAWSYSQAMAATIDLVNIPKYKKKYSSDIHLRVQGLQAYWDIKANPPGYDSAVLPPYGKGGDIYYDDNDWLGLDLVQAYQHTGSKFALKRAKQVFQLEVSGWDNNSSDPYPGGVFWTQMSGNHYRNTATNAPAAELGLQLYKITDNSYYLHWAKKMYNWVDTNLRAPNGLYWDGIHIDGSYTKDQWSYNQGTMLGAAVLLYQITGDKSYLKRAENTANAALEYYNGNWDGQGVKFNAVFFENLLLLDSIHHDSGYRQAMQSYADHIWNTYRDSKTGLFKFDPNDVKVNMIDQAAATRIYADLAAEKPAHDLGQLLDLIDKYTDTGDIQSSFGQELKYRITIIKHLIDQGDKKQAKAYLEDFSKHINDPAVLKQGLISKKATEKLNGKTKNLLEDW